MTASDRSSSRPTTPGFRRGRRINDLMTRELHAFVVSSNAAERAGDARAALDYHLGVPMFRRSAHRVVLEQMVDLEDEMTPWLWARWAAYQCTRVEDPGTEPAAVTRLALDYTLRFFHGQALQAVYDDGGDPMPIIARTMGEDWVCHQLCTYELGGLELFLDTVAEGRLAERAALARDWIGSEVSGYRLEPAPPGRLVVHDLAEDRPVELLDLGAGLHAGPGGWLLGRLVPSGTTPALMFDTRPLPVDERTARDAARGVRRGAWVTALAQAFDAGRVDREVLQREDRELATDVASLSLLERGTPAGQLAAARDQLARGRDEIGRAAFRVLRAVAESSWGDDDRAFVAAAVLNPHGYAEARRRLTAPGHRAAWERWSRLVPDPARGRLARLADLSDASAA